MYLEPVANSCMCSKILFRYFEISKTALVRPIESSISPVLMSQKSNLSGNRPRVLLDSCTNPPDEEVSTRNMVFFYSDQMPRCTSQHQAQALNVTLSTTYTSCLVVVRASPARRPCPLAKAGLQFPVGRIARYLKAGKYATRVGAVPTCTSPRSSSTSPLRFSSSPATPPATTRATSCPATSSWRSATMRSSPSSWHRHHRLGGVLPTPPCSSPRRARSPAPPPGVLRASPPPRNVDRTSRERFRSIHYSSMVFKS